jgi:hypothetical protein
MDINPEHKIQLIQAQKYLHSVRTTKRQKYKTDLELFEDFVSACYGT